MKLIRFVPSQPPYMAGEMAGFDEADAARYVNAGVAVYLSDAEVKALRAPKKPAKPAEQDTVLVRFIGPARDGDPRPPAPYRAGETAAFSIDIAEGLIDSGVAELADKPSTPPPAGAPADPGKPVMLVFVESAYGYMAGETATVPASEAKIIIASGKAVLPGDAPSKPAPTTAEPDVDVIGRTDRAGIEPITK